MSEQACCDHLHVSYRTEELPNFGTHGWWACDCGRRFAPIANTASDGERVTPMDWLLSPYTVVHVSPESSHSAATFSFSGPFVDTIDPQTGITTTEEWRERFPQQPQEPEEPAPASWWSRVRAKVAYLAKRSLQ